MLKCKECEKLCKMVENEMFWKSIIYEKSLCETFLHLFHHWYKVHTEESFQFTLNALHIFVNSNYAKPLHLY